MANPIIQAIYDLKDNISAKINTINAALRGNQKETDKTADASERSGKRISDSYKRTADSIGQLRTALAGIAAFVGLDKLKDGIEEVLKAGEDLHDLEKRFATAFGGLEQGAKAFEQVRELAKGVPQSFADVSDAAIALKKAGFDPLDGSLQALLDNANATNQSQEQLIGTIEALGKANIKGAVNIKSLVTLTESGIPVFDLLGKAMGVSADRVRQLAESGQLGQDSIKLLVTQLGKLRAGASADELGDLDAQLTKVKDVAKQFLETIANSGSLDFFRKALQDLTKQAEDAAKSGKLQEIAKSISDGIVSGAKAIGGAAKFILDHAGAIVTLTKAYAAFKISGVALDLAKLGIGFKDTSKAAGDAATSADKVTKSVKGIPTNLKVALALIGFDVAVAVGEKLGDLISDLSGDTQHWKDVQEGLRNEIQKNAVGFAEIASQLAGYRDQQVLAAKDVATLSDAERDAYAQRLAGLTKYLQAQVLYLTNLDRAGLAGKEELDRLAALKAQLEAAKNGQLALAEGAKAAADAITSKLTPSAQLLANKLEEIKDDSKAVGEAVGKAFADFDLQKNISAVGDFATAFDQVAAKGGKAADTLNHTLLESLKNLSGEDLLRFQTGASFAIGKLGDDAEKTSDVLRDTLEVALDKLGTKAEDTGQAITKAGQNTIAAFTAVASNAQATAQTIAAAFDSALASAKTVEEAKTLGDVLKAAGERGAVGLKELADAGRDVEERIRTLTASVDPLRSQFDLLGIKSQAALEATRDNAREALDAIVAQGRSIEDIRRAYVAYAQTALAAGDASDQSTRDQIESNLQLLASVLGIPDAFVKAGDAGKKAGKDTSDAFDKAKQSIDDAGNAAEDAADKFNNGSQAWGDQLAATANAAASATQGIILLTNEQLRLLGEIRDEFLSGAISGEQYAERVKVAMGGVDEELLKQQQNFRDFQNQLDQLNSDIAGQTGDTQTQEDIRHAQKLRDLEDEFQQQGKYTLAQYKQLIDAENKLHALKLKNTQSEQQAGSGESGGFTPNKGTPSAPQAPDNITQRGTAVPGLTVDFTGATIIGGNEKQLGEILARIVKPALDNIARRSV